MSVCGHDKHQQSSPWLHSVDALALAQAARKTQFKIYTGLSPPPALPMPQATFRGDITTPGLTSSLPDLCYADNTRPVLRMPLSHFLPVGHTHLGWRSLCGTFPIPQI